MKTKAESGALRQRLDQERPIFDYARNVLTLYAWIGISILIFKAFSIADPLERVVMVFPLIGAPAFTAFLMFRLHRLNEDLEGLMSAKGHTWRFGALAIGFCQLGLLLGVSLAAFTLLVE